MSDLQHIAELVERGGTIAVIRTAHPQIEIDTLEIGEKFYIEPQVDELEQRISRLESLLKRAYGYTTAADDLLPEEINACLKECGE